MGDKRVIKRAGVCVVWLAVLAVPACGGSSSSSSSPGNASCSSQTACGGNVVGTWKVESECTSASMSSSPGLSGFCPSATLGTGGIAVSGTLTFGSDSSYSFTLVEGGSFRYTIPSSCLTVNGQTVSCSELSAAVSMSLGTDASFSGVSCQASGSNCVCDFKLASQTNNESGTYSVAGTNLALMPTGGTATSDGFCATSSELHLSEVDTSMDAGMMGSISVSGEIVASKQ